MQRLEQYTRSIGRLLRAAGVSDDSPPADDVDGVTSDVDVEALMKSTLDATREFDAFLVSLVHEAPPEAISLRQEIDRLEQDLKDKAQLVEQTRALLRDHQKSLVNVSAHAHQVIFPSAPPNAAAGGGRAPDAAAATAAAAPAAAAAASRPSA
ncbi:hypothetical protein BU14_0617s0011 [Porphyra umbilicalis]|uniref:Uncharacterized protein n=1 Tax=Porphyra umbilicalis TaxID=2786 RepID=A0A1X6NR01_PORUM|nr:hypothetical protein BU14_0617s0011 [Porphyra umbilicalis]|eukprot:OSX71005.1 hypothetical protein BU14_0617s0011 [Porphyra umbilicalis]